VYEHRVLEVIACSVRDAVEAERGGADRLEIVRDLDRGGLTPSLSLVQEIRRKVALPLRVMLRQHEKYALRDQSELEDYRKLAGELAAAGVNGFVFGFLREGQIDAARTAVLLDCDDRMNATFHHAFDEADDPIAAIAALKKCPGVDRILSGGGLGSWEEKARQLTLYCERAEPEITILAGGGLNASAIRLLMERTPVREFHAGRAVRQSARADGNVQAGLVRELARIVHSSRPVTEGHGTP
jgi:copper homeostasis protein